ncbi:hypothetical protein V8G54_022948 [Vigna mungo]|uniref:Uncharacterized protein n=1 Tax=Vigna mungo TaxID=3915 RepID=A0AAQ3N3J9_VIGMU
MKPETCLSVAHNHYSHSGHRKPKSNGVADNEPHRLIHQVEVVVLRRALLSGIVPLLLPPSKSCRRQGNCRSRHHVTVCYSVNSVTGTVESTAPSSLLFLCSRGVLSSSPTLGRDGIRCQDPRRQRWSPPRLPLVPQPPTSLPQAVRRGLRKQ